MNQDDMNQALAQYEDAWNQWKAGDPLPKPNVPEEDLPEFADRDESNPVWYWGDGKSERGPFTFLRLQHLAEAKAIPADGLVRRGRVLRAACAVFQDMYFLEEGNHRYRLTDVLGRGGMGTVFLAEDCITPRNVAIKAILPGHGSAAALREASILARMRPHPNIVQLYTTVEDHGCHYLVMEYVEGKNLLDLLADVGLPVGNAGGSSQKDKSESVTAFLETLALVFSRLPRWQRAEAVAKLMLKLAKAVDHAHAWEVFHQDLKPQNVFMEGGEEPKIGDFGLADTVGTVGGTIAYMAPEQLELWLMSRRVPTDPTASDQVEALRDLIGARTDVYGLGAIFYELLTGQPPHQIPKVNAVSTAGAVSGVDAVEQLLQMVNTQEPIAPRERNPDVPVDLQAICLKCLNRNAAQRYQTAGKLAEDLAKWLERAPISARQEPWWATTLLYPIRKPLRTGIAGGVAAGLLILLLSFGWAYANESARADREAKENADAQKETAIALQREADAQKETALAQKGEAEAKKEIAEQKQREADRDKHLQRIETLHRQADAQLATLARQRSADGPRFAPAIPAQIQQLNDLRPQANAILQQLGSAGEQVRAADQRRWDDRVIHLRRHLTWAGTTIGLQHEQTISLPPGNVSIPPRIALRAPGGVVEEIALVYPGATRISILDREGKLRRELDIPAPFARVSLRQERSHLELLSRDTTNTNTSAPAARLAFTPTGLEYQVAFQQLSWTGQAEEPAQKAMQPHQLPQPLHGNHHASSHQHLAAVDTRGVNVTLTEWAAKSKPVLVWWARGGDLALGGELVQQIAFCPDGRALGILTNQRLAIVDTASGAASEVDLPNTRTKRAREINPYPGGLALLDHTGDQTSSTARLAFYRITLPDASNRSLRFQTPAHTVSAVGAKRIAVGTGDGVVHAMHGNDRPLSLGIPFLGQHKGRPVHDDIHHGRLPQQTDRFSVQVAVSGRKRWIDSAFAQGPNPYPTIGFTPHHFLVRRLESSPQGGSHLRTELYAPTTGKLVDTFPTEGTGRLVALSEDGLFAVVVAKESPSHVTLQTIQLQDRQVLGETRVPRAFPWRVHFFEARGQYYLCVATAYTNTNVAAEWTAWRLDQREKKLDLVGRFSLPHVDGFVMPIPDKRQVIVWRPRGGARGPVYASVIDLYDGSKVCDLEGFSTTSNIEGSLFTPTHYIFATRQGAAADPNDGYRVGVWDLTTGKRTALDVQPWSGQELPEMEVSPDGQYLALGGRLFESQSGQLRIYNLATGELVRGLSFTGNLLPRVSRLANSHFAVEMVNPTTQQSAPHRFRWSDGAELKAKDGDEVVKVSRDFMGEYLWLLWRGPKGLSLQRGYAGKKVLLAGTAGITGRLDIRWPKGENGVFALNALETGLWDARTGERRGKEFPEGYRCLGFDYDGRWALLHDRASGEVKILDAQTGKEAFPAPATTTRFDLDESGWHLHADGRHLVVLDQGVPHLWNLATNQRLATLPKSGHTSAVRCVAQHPRHSRVASAGDDGIVLIRDTDAPADQSKHHTIVAHTDAITALCFSGDGESIISVSRGNVIAGHDLKGKPLWTISVPKDTPITCLVAHPRTPHLLAGLLSGKVLVLDAQTGKQERVIDRTDAESGAIASLTMSPDGTHIAVGTARGVTIRAWTDGRMVKTWPTYRPVTGLAFVGGNRLLAVGGSDLQFVDLQDESTRAVWSVDVPGGTVRGLALNHDTGELAVLAQDNEVLAYPMPALHAKLEAAGLALDAFPKQTWKVAPPTPPRTPPSRDDWCLRAEELHAQRQWHPLLWLTSAALRQWPDQARLWFLRGEAESQFPERAGPARQAYFLALERDKNDGRIWRACADQHVLARDLKQAESAYTKAIELSGSDPDWQLYSIRALVRQQLGFTAPGKRQEVFEDLLTVVLLNPDHWETWRQIGLLQIASDDWQGAEMSFRQAAALLPHNRDLQRQHALTLLHLDRIKEYRQACTEMVPRFRGMGPSDVAEVLWLTALAPDADFEKKPTLELANRLLARAPQVPWHRHVVGAVRYRAGDLRAISDLEQTTVLHKQGGIAQSWFVLSMAYHQNGEAQKATNAFDKGEQALDQSKGSKGWEERIELESLKQEAHKLLKLPERLPMPFTPSTRPP